MICFLDDQEAFALARLDFVGRDRLTDSRNALIVCCPDRPGA
jgi:hypothetical protein